MAATLTPQQAQVARMLYTLGRSRGLSHGRALEFAAAAYSESGLSPSARNPSSGAAGLFQLLSSGYRQKAQALGGLNDPRANALAILGDYKNYWASHPGAQPGQGGAAVERSGEGAGFYSKGLGLVGQAVGAGGPATAPSAPSAPPAPAMAAPPVDTTALRQQALQSLISNVGQKQPDLTDFLGGLQAIKTAETASPVAAPAPSTPRTVTAAPSAVRPSGKGGGFLPAGAVYKAGRADQGRDFSTNPGGAIIAPGSGVVVRVGSDPNGFGPSYPIIRFTSGPYKGMTLYIGHTFSALRPGQRFTAGQVLSRTGTSGVGNAHTPGWAEIGYAPGGNPGRFGQHTPF